MTLSTRKRSAVRPNPAMPPRGDEFTPILDYVITEMANNAKSPAAMRIRENNLFSAPDCIEQYYSSLSGWEKFFAGSAMLDMCTNRVMTAPLAAITGWAMLVHEGGDWDHKPYIRAHFTPAVGPGDEQHWHHYQGYVYFYDIWSNIHYGYVGRACGFTRAALLDGGGLEQIGSDLIHLRWPQGDSSVDGLRRFDDASDRASVALGCDIWPGIPTREDLRDRILAAPVRKKAL